ncbi:MAG: hypothetical protein QXG01_07290 [Candidatus Bathyarchaeia archaeon]
MSKNKLESGLSAISLGVLLIICALTWLYHPKLPSELISYLKSWGDFGHPIAPSLTLIKPMSFFAYALGVWLLILAIIKGLLRVYGASSDFFGGAFFVSFGYVLGLFLERKVSIDLLLPVVLHD